MRSLGNLMAAGMLAIAATFAGLVGGPAQAQAQAKDWPTQPVKLILPLGAGSGADISARLIAEQLSKRWGQPVVIENRPGGDGFVAIKAFTGSTDDHTFLYGPAASFVAHPFLYKELPYDPKQLSPIAQVSNTVVSITIPAKAEFKTLDEIFAAAKKNPGKLNWASIVGVTDFVIMGFLKDQGLDMARVPYKNPVQALTDLAQNRIQFYSSAYAITRPQIDAGRVRLLAVSNAERAPALKDVPTVAELGYPGLTFDGLVGIYGPPDMPKERRERIAKDVVEIVNTPEVTKRLIQTGQLVTPGGADHFAASIKAMRESLDGTAKILGVKPAN